MPEPLEPSMPETLFAETPDGTRLPVIDVSLPAFAVPRDKVEIDAIEAVP